MKTIEQAARELLFEGSGNSISKPASYESVVKKLGKEMYHDTMGGGSSYSYGPSEVHKLVSHIYGVNPKIVHMHVKMHHDRVMEKESAKQK